MLWCSCEAWYPVEDGLLELLVGELAYADDRQAFWDRHAERLTAIGLRPSVPSETAAPSQALQSTQQEHFDWYAANDQQTYSSYEQTP